mmetsp:Transcript_20266/g.33444  ORF Transcript_20266/g.33444 Transcript_20266/m.33444 type:complete len:207 (-) Transcript_20266:288-908(-)|eukprot:CAMPEP_0203760676 /NCGR_PEP_ID=MMETSP0098-20131031/13921_1 /ASSEMBLY_ACC=CAM_ASM_000208 /TAXON_ID=96639 /ORGANISM=" , Strain NY0313808BC1" /LENGTH=206 /DNA_ID=CAMNT_0050654347 /DNA_START=83 /DNA_END=703 /DNA_ORIENTATION=-
MVKLYNRPGACSLADHIVLHWIGEPFHLEKPEYGDPAFLKLNPTGAVPTLVTDDNKVITQNQAILTYLAKKSGHPEWLGGADLIDQAEVTKWCSFITGDLHPAFFPVFVSSRYTTAEDDESKAKVKAAGVVLVNNKLQVLNNHMEGRTYLATNEKTIADAYLVPMLRWSNNVVDGGLKKYPNLEKFFNHMLQDDGVKKAMAADKLT